MQTCTPELKKDTHSFLDNKYYRNGIYFGNNGNTYMQGMIMALILNTQPKP